MLQAVLAIVLLIGTATTAPAAQESNVAAQATTQPVVVAAATQPIAVLVTPEQLARADDETLTQVFARTRMGQLFEGKKKVTLEDVKNPVFWIDTVKDLIVAVIGFIPRLVVALLFLVFFWLIYRAVRKLVVGSMGKASVDPSIRDMLGWLIKWAIMGFGIVIACNQVGIQIAALLTGVSIIGLAVGFAAQETLANFIAGIVIFWDKPFKLGDWVQVDGTFGKVQRVTFRSTRILNLDGEVIIIPNTRMLSDKVSNHSTNPFNRVTVCVGIAYKESIADARRVMLALVKDDARVCKTPAPEVVVTELAASSVNLELRIWIEDESIERKIKYELLERVKNALDAANIQIPFPHLQLIVEETEAIQTLSPNPVRRAG
jgi:small conductance mechanosensitive channel